jgi:8-oxo-dGTP diphosphatase
MKERKVKSRVPILAAGGIVLRNNRRPQFAIVQLRKTGAWGLPKGKLAPGEDAMAAARREVLEETGYRATMHEFLGTLVYEASGRPKVVQFWRMEASGEPIGALTRDVRAVHWLELGDGIDRLTHLRERVFLEQVGPIALKLVERSERRLVRRALSAAHIPTIGKGVPLAPAADGNPPLTHRPAEDREVAEPIEQEPVEQELAAGAALVPAADASALARLSERTGQAQGIESGLGRALIEKTWGWLRHAATPHRQPPD